MKTIQLRAWNVHCTHYCVKLPAIEFEHIICDLAKKECAFAVQAATPLNYNCQLTEADKGAEFTLIFPASWLFSFNAILAQLGYRLALPAVDEGEI